jgi:hypothetical protein
MSNLLGTRKSEKLEAQARVRWTKRSTKSARGPGRERSFRDVIASLRRMDPPKLKTPYPVLNFEDEMFAEAARLPKNHKTSSPGVQHFPKGYTSEDPKGTAKPWGFVGNAAEVAMYEANRAGTWRHHQGAS